MRSAVTRDPQTHAADVHVLNGSTYYQALLDLRARGVVCRSDPAHQLLFDDSSVVIESAGFAGATTQRFVALWDAATP